MKLYRTGWLAIGLALFATGAVQAQNMKSITLSGDDIKGQPYMLDELGAVIVHKGGALEALHVGQAEHRPEAYRDVDLKTGDKLVMANGVKLKSIDDLKAALEGVKVGAKIKFGIQRGKDIRMISYAKADPADLPKRKMMMVGGPGGEEGKGGGTFTSAGDAGELVTPLMGSGLIMSWKDAGAVVAFMMPDAALALGKDTDVKEGDHLLSLQGEAFEDAEALSTQWDAIEAGTEVTMVFARGDEEFKVKFSKAKAPKGARFIKQ